MVQKYKSPVRVYTHPFEIVMAAYEKRFPTCPMIPAFIGSEIILDQTSEDGAVQVIERRCKLNVEVPYLLKKFVGVDYCMFIQKNTLDRRRRVLQIEAHNESFANRIFVTETCVYSVHPENPEWTCFEQEAGLEIKSFFGFEKAVEKIAIQTYSQNIKKGKEVIEHYISELTSQGITFISPWQPSSTADGHSSVSDTSVIDTNLDAVTDEITRKAHITPPKTVSSSHRRHVKPDDHSDSAFLSLSTTSLIDPATMQSPNRDAKPKLSAEYIRRHLGELSPAEESALVQLRELLSESHKNQKLPKYSVMLRFLRAHADPEAEGNFDHVERAHDMLARSLAWRKMHAVDKLLETYVPPDLLGSSSPYWPCGWHGNDKQGRPVYILRLGKMDIKGVLRSMGVAAVIRHVLAAEEEGIHRTEVATRESHNAVTTCMCVVDLEGLSMRHLWRPGVSFFLDLITLLTQHYPESLSQMLIVRAPLLFPILWGVTAAFLDEKTRSKFMVYAGQDCLAGLSDFIDADSLPQNLGGSCRCNAKCCVDDSTHVTLVPKSNYQYSVLELEKDGLPLSHEYKTVAICAHYPHEVALWAQPGSVIHWDFDIVRGDVAFSLFYVGDSAPLTEPRHIHTACTTGAPLTACSGGVSSGTVQFLDPKTLPVGGSDSSDGAVELIERTHQCRDGDSLQGSHIVQKGGAYVLQWKMRPSSASSASSQPSPSVASPPILAVPHSVMSTSTGSAASSGTGANLPASDSLFTSAINSIAAATSGRVMLVYYTDVLPLAKSEIQNLTNDNVSISNMSSISGGENALPGSVFTTDSVTACWQSAASLHSPGSSNSNYAAFFTSTTCTAAKQNMVSTNTTSILAAAFKDDLKMQQSS